VGDYLLGEKQSARIHLINLAVVLSQLALWALQYADHRSSWRLGLLIHWGALTPWSLLMFIHQARRGIWTNPRPPWDDDRRLWRI
jgi:hypothetical protein